MVKSASSQFRKFYYPHFSFFASIQTITQRAGNTALKGGLWMAILLSAAFVVPAQPNEKALQLEEAILLATAQNKDIALAELDEKVARFRYRQTSAAFLPQANLSYTAMISNNPLHAFGMKLQQRNIGPSDFDPQLLNHPSATSDFTATLSVQQPIINIDHLYQRKGAFQQTISYQFKTRRSKEYITFLVQQAYLQLQLAYETEVVMEEARQMVKSIHQFTRNRFQEGLLQKSDVLNAEVQLKQAETGVSEAKDNIHNASDLLSVLMNRPTGTIYTISPFPTAPFIENIPDRVSGERSDFKAMEAAILSYNLMIKSSKMSFIPRLNAFGSYQYNDHSLAGFSANAYLAGLQLSWDLFKGNQTKNKILSQTASRDKLNEELAKLKEEAALEFNKIQRRFSQSRYRIGQQETAVDLATEALRILQNRYDQGLVNTTDVLMAQTQLSRQKLMYRQAIFENRVTSAYLQFLAIQ